MSYLPAYITPYNNAVTAYLQGVSVNPPVVGTNLTGPGVLGKYGKTSFSNSGAGAKVQAKQIMCLIGKRLAVVPTLILLTPFGGFVGNMGAQMPPYGN